MARMPIFISRVPKTERGNSQRLAAKKGKIAFPLRSRRTNCLMSLALSSRAQRGTGAPAVTGHGLVSPAARLQQVLFVELADVEPLHGAAQCLGSLEHDLCVLVVRCRPDNAPSALHRVARLEYARANKYRLRSELHNECRVGGSSDAAGREIRDRQLSILCHPADQFQRRAQLLSFMANLFFPQPREH